MTAAYHRHDISDVTWTLLEPRLLGRKGTRGGNARDNCQLDASINVLADGDLALFGIRRAGGGISSR